MPENIFSKSVLKVNGVFTSVGKIHTKLVGKQSLGDGEQDFLVVVRSGKQYFAEVLFGNTTDSPEVIDNTDEPILKRTLLKDHSWIDTPSPKSLPITASAQERYSQYESMVSVMTFMVQELGFNGHVAFHKVLRVGHIDVVLWEISRLQQ